MESDDCIDFVNHLASILESFFKGLSECGFMSTYSVQLQAVGSDVALHLRFQQLVYQVVKSLKELLRRLSRVPGCETITTECGAQTDNRSSYPFGRRCVYMPCSENVDSKKIMSTSSEIPLKVLVRGAKTCIDSKVRSNSTPLPSGNTMGSGGDFSDPLDTANSTTVLNCHSSRDSRHSDQHHSLEDIAHLNGKMTKLPLSTRLSTIPSDTTFSLDSSRQNKPRTFSSSLQSSVPNSRNVVQLDEKVSSGRLPLIASSSEDGPHKTSMDHHHILNSNTSNYSEANQIHSIETSSGLVSQDLIAVLGSEDVSNQQQSAVLFISAEDAREGISNEGTDLPERQLDGGNIPIEVEAENTQNDSSIYSYSDVGRKDNSSVDKNMKVDIVTSLRDNEDDLVLFCKDEVELDPMTSVGAVEKDGELMSIFTRDSAKEDEDEGSAILYANGNVLNAKKSANFNGIASTKDTINEHFFSKKLASGGCRGSEFGLIAIKMEDLNSRCSEEESGEFSKNHSEESCAQLTADKVGPGNSEDMIGIEDDIDPEDELGSNFVHIVVTASKVMPDGANGGKHFDAPRKVKCGKCELRNGSECSCNSCETDFPMLSSVQCQLKKKHGYVSQCDFCHKVFPTIGSLVDHCRDVHDGAGCFECEECGKRLKSRLSLRRHMESHQGRKEAICSKCGKTFCRWDYLIRHCQMVHAKERPYQCPHCSQRFLSRGHLQNHLAVHSGERNHKCGICGKMFSRGDKLREHTFRHSSTKRYSCSTCGRSYADKRDLNKHQIREPGCKSAGKRVQVKIDANVSVGKQNEEIL
ncbi:uncharacterized protein [Hetaerina americana]|uniref:uncharacterized protein n=1 Tax=Hetaerina americana TaxID=62018 RepID=UPI003A7F31D9